MPTFQERLHSAIDAHSDRVDQFRAGQIPPEEFRPMRLSYGLYAQLPETTHLQRIKIPGGLLTAAQADAMAEAGERWGRGLLHVTTRQDIQLHWVPLESVREMYHLLQDVGISTRGACSDSVRNITASPCAGTCDKEPFDVLPYTFALEEYFLFHPLNLTLPRKFKPSFVGCSDDEAQGVINDLAYYARRVEGRDGFSVLVGGGLGAAPHLAKPLVDFIAAEDTLAVAEAVVRLQHRFGERKSRHKARLKFLVQRMGLEKFRAATLRELERVQAERGAELREELRSAVARYHAASPVRPASPALPAPSGSPLERWLRTNVRAQRQPGYYAATVTLPLGDVSCADFRRVTALAVSHGDGTLRATNDQNLVLSFIPGADLALVHERLVAIGLAEAGSLHLSDVTSCPGADYCSLAVTKSMSVAARIRSDLAEAEVAVDSIGKFRVKVSGCPNSCGQHHIADIGLTGMMVKDESGTEHPHCSILIGGRVGENSAALGKRLRGRFPEEDVPRVIGAITAAFRAQRLPSEPFREFVERVGVAEMQRAAESASASVR